MLFRGLNLYALYSIIKRLVTPFENTTAYKLGIIDKDGNRTNEPLDTPDKRKAYTAFDVFVFNMKKLLAKVPGGSSRIATYSAALYLLKESSKNEDAPVNSMASGAFDIFNVPLYKKKDDELEEDEEEFIGKKVFVVDGDTYDNFRFCKPKYHKYMKYLKDNDLGHKIHRYAIENPNKPIIVKHSTLGTMRYLRKGKGDILDQ